MISKSSNSGRFKVNQAQEQLEEAYNNIFEILNYSESMLQNFDSMWFDFELEKKSLTEKIFFSNFAENKPEAIYVVDIEKERAEAFYLMGNTFSKGIIESYNTEIAGCLKKQEYCIYNYNGDQKSGKCRRCLPEDIKSNHGTLKNHIVHLACNYIVIAVNYGYRAGILEWQNLKGYALTLLLYRTIYRQTKKVRDAFIYTSGALARAAEAVDGETGYHIQRVGEFSKRLAQKLDMSKREVDEISYSAQMHDVGKMKIGAEILLKNGPLTKEEFMEMENHTVYGVMILGDSPYLQMARDIALSHHEKCDGTGYPFGLQGEDIPLSARIVAVADVYDALRSRRPYKQPIRHDEACEIIIKGDGRSKPEHFCPYVLEAFQSIEREFEKIYERIS